jgi:hypothetical protein
MAVASRFRKMVALLFQYGADPEKIGKSGLTPYGLAETLKWDHIFAIIEHYHGTELKEGACEYWDWMSEEYTGKKPHMSWEDGSKVQQRYVSRMEEEDKRDWATWQDA